jgi:drug/metabolite transporter (DMT)-like permease
MTPLETVCQIAMACCLAALAAVAVTGLSAGEGGTPALIGCAFAAGAGVTITIAQLYAKRLHNAGASAAAVVATRFLGVLAAAVVALSFMVDARAAAISPNAWLALAPAAFVFMAVPIYLNQIGVQLASPLTVRVLLALGPVFVIALQTAVGGMALSGYSLAGVAAYCAIAIAAALMRAISARAATAGAPASAPSR